MTARARAHPSRPSAVASARSVWRSCSASLCTALVVGGVAIASATTAAAQASPAPLELVPAYFAPEGSPNPWHTMCEAAPAGSTVILNPDNGPVKKQAKAYAEPMRLCVEHGQRVIGYVYTKYGRRSLSTVKKAIADYYSWYPTVGGIFLDEMAELPSAKVETYYRQLTAYVHEKGGFVVANPGDTATTSWQLGVVDQVVTFEGSAASYAAYSPPAWVLAARPQQIANIIFAAPESSQMEADCARATAGNTGSVYVTNLAEKPNPYATLPSYWAGEAAIC